MEGLLARELVAELNDLTRAVRGLVQLVGLVVEDDSLRAEDAQAEAELKRRLLAIVAASTTDREQ